MDCKYCFIVAAYLSIYDSKAISQLGYKTWNSALKDIAIKLGDLKPTYIKNLRDEFDAITGNHRIGWVSRPARKSIISIYEEVKVYSFEDFSRLVLNVLGFNETNIMEIKSDITYDDEQLLEKLMAIDSSDSGYRFSSKMKKYRVCNRKIIDDLKKLYNGQCQLCGESYGINNQVDITEGHHIEYFTKTQNDSVNNIILLCPNCHSLIHKLNPIFDRENMSFIYEDGTITEIKKNKHLVKQ
jgi:hypothetical protein